VSDVISQGHGRVQSITLVSWDEHADDIVSSSIDEHLAEDAHRHPPQLGLLKLTAGQLIKNGNQSVELRADVVINEVTAGLGGLQHLTKHQPVLPPRAAKAEHPLEHISNETTKPVASWRAHRPGRERHLGDQLLMGLPDGLVVEPLLVAKVVVDRGDVHTSRQTDMANGGGLKASLGKLLSGRRENPLPGIVGRTARCSLVGGLGGRHDRRVFLEKQ